MTQVKFVQISIGGKYGEYLAAIDTEGRVWRYYGGWTLIQAPIAQEGE